MAALLGPAQRVHQLLVAATGLILSFRPSLQRVAVAVEWAIVLLLTETQQQVVLARVVVVQALLETRQALHQVREIMVALAQAHRDTERAAVVEQEPLEGMAQLPLAVMVGLVQFLIFPAHLLPMLEAAVAERGQIPQPPVALAVLAAAEMEPMLLELPVQQIPVAEEVALEPAVGLRLMLLAQAVQASSS